MKNKTIKNIFLTLGALLMFASFPLAGLGWPTPEVVSFAAVGLLLMIISLLINIIASGENKGMKLNNLLIVLTIVGAIVFSIYNFNLIVLLIFLVALVVACLRRVSKKYIFLGDLYLLASLILLASIYLFKNSGSGFDGFFVPGFLFLLSLLFIINWGFSSFKKKMK
jgi:hypothetical protein